MDEKFLPHAFIDTPAFSKPDEKGRVSLVGWFLLGKGAQPKKVEITVNGRPEATVDFSIRRPDVLKAYPNYEVEDLIGFSHTLILSNEEVLDVKVRALDNEGAEHCVSKTIIILPVDCDERNKQMKEELKTCKCLNEYPLILFIEVTTYCNLSCIMCSPRRFIKGGFFEREKFEKLEKFISNAKVINLYGLGEPTLNPDFPYFINRCRQLNAAARINFVTNMNQLETEVLDTIIGDSPISIAISMDAATKETYERIRVNGSWEKLVANIEKLVKRKEESKSKYPEICFTYVLQKDNVGELVEFIQLVNKISKPHFIAINNIIDHPELEINPQEHKEIFKAALEIIDENNNCVDGSAYHLMKRLLGIEDPHDPTIKRGSDDPICFEPFQTFYVKIDGSIRVCCNNDVEFGKLEDSEVLDIWGGYHYNLLRQSMFKNPVMADCKLCIKEGRNMLKFSE